METIYYLQQFATPMLDQLALLITNLGSQDAYIISLLVVYLLIDNYKGRWLGMVLLSSLYINFHLKGMITTDRPYVIDASVARSESAVATGTGYSFPSGHAQGIMTLWGLAALLFRPWWFKALAIVVIAFVALSRVYLGVHVPLDIYGGLAIGVLVVLLSYRLYRYVTHQGLPHAPRALVIAVGIVVPLVLHVLLPTPDSEVLLGGLAAFITGPLLLPYRTHGVVWWRRLLVFVLGLVLVFALLLGSSLALSETMKDNAYIAFVRYLLVGWAGVLFAPALAYAIKVLPKAAAGHTATPA